MISLKSTLVFGVPVGDTKRRDSVTGTVVGYVANTPATRPLIDLDETLVSESPAEGAIDRTMNPMSTQVRTTVLPRRTKTDDGEARHVLDERPRFDRVRQLGEGAVGTVELQRDNDIRRTVAVKKLRAEVKSDGSFLRFADEVRIVGQLEHPGIVPIYDVGRDESGDVYLVMKHLEGETMEDIIDKLRAGDPATVARFPVETRAHLFVGVLDAIRYAHSRGILHRDLKPANIMIGPFDEVTVMDWGIAKPIGKRESVMPSIDSARSWLDSADQRLLETQIGTLAGTPFYMSPEQAAGLNDSLDERSDVFSLAIVFYEWLTLTHPLEGKSTLIEVLANVITQEHDFAMLMKRSRSAGVPVEFIHLISHGLRRDRDLRMESAAKMHDVLKAILEGRVPVQCAVTATKRVTLDALKWIDRHTMLFVAGLAVFGVSAVVGIGALLVTLVRAIL